MKAVSQTYKDNIKQLGKEIDAYITYSLNGTTYTLNSEILNSINKHYDGGILQSVMQQLDINSTEDIPIGTEINCQFGVKVDDDDYEYVDFGNFIIYSSEKQEDSNSYKIVAYDKMLNSMKDYLATFDYVPTTDTEFSEDKTYYEYDEDYEEYTGNIYFLTEDETFIEDKRYFEYVDNEYELYDGERTGDPSALGLYELGNPSELGLYEYKYVPLSFPMTVREFITEICTQLGLTFENESDTFPNYDKEIQNELYLDTEGNDIGFTYRDILDQLAQVTASTICINDNGNLELRYIKDALNRNMFDLDNWNDVNVNTSIYGDSWERNGKDITLHNTSGRDLYLANGVTGNGSTVSQQYRKYYISCKPNTQYTLSFTKYSQDFSTSSADSSYLDVVNENNVVIDFQSLTGGFSDRAYKTFTTGADAKYILFRFGTRTSIGSITYSNIILQEGSSTEYEPYGISTIDEEYLKDINVNFGEVIEPINTITFRRSESDEISLSYPEDLPNDQKNEIVISDNQILNFDNRDEYLQDILSQLYGLSYALNDFNSTGITFYELCDKYNVSITKTDDEGNTIETNVYPCIMFNDEINISQGLEEIVHTERGEETPTDFNTTTKTDRLQKRTNLIVNKQEGYIEAITGELGMVDGESQVINGIQSKQTDTESIINVITSFDENGSPTGVRTEKGFTFDKDGLKIKSSENSYNSLHNEKGDYYFNGEEPLGETTPDGSKFRNMDIYGEFRYGKDEIGETALFVSMLYNDGTEECFGHFYNGREVE